jgi:hypothetical protein
LVRGWCRDRLSGRCSRNVYQICAAVTSGSLSSADDGCRRKTGIRPARRGLNEKSGDAPPCGRAHRRRGSLRARWWGREASAHPRSTTAGGRQAYYRRPVTFETHLGGGRQTPETRGP